MPANTAPVFPLTPVNTWAIITTADATAAKNHDGTSAVAADIPTIFTAGANGARVDNVYAVPQGTNVASVLRIFINNGSVNTTQANNTLVAEVTLPATTISEIAAQSVITVPLGFAIPNGYKVNACLGTTVAAGWSVTCVGGSY